MRDKKVKIIVVDGVEWVPKQMADDALREILALRKQFRDSEKRMQLCIDVREDELTYARMRVEQYKDQEW